MRSPLQLSILLITLLCAQTSSGQGNGMTPDTTADERSPADTSGTDTNKTDSVQRPIPPNPYPSYRIDTLRFSDVHRHTPLEDPFRPGLGNLALDSYSLLPDAQGQSRIGHRFGLPPNPYGIAPKEPLSFDLRYPVTRLGYSLGSDEEQFFHITHSQNITPRWNATVRFRKLGSPGAYPRQKTNSGDFLFSTHYRAPAGTYQARLAYRANRSSFQQNGGISDPQLFEADEQDNRGAFRVRLDEAESFSKIDEVRLDHAIFPTGRDFSDSADGGSTELGAYHKGLARSMRLLYTDQGPGSPLYPRIHFDSSATEDLLRSRQLQQEAGVILQRKEGRGIRGELRLGYRARLIENRLLDHSDSFRDDAARLYGNWELGRNTWEGEAAYGVMGYGEGDRLMDWEHRYGTEEKGLFDSLAIELSYKERRPAYTESRYRSNHFVWDREFPRTRSYHARARWGEPKEKEGLALSYTRLDNFIYFGHSAHPLLADRPVTFTRAHLRKNLSLGKWNLDLQGAWQKEWESELIRVPQYLLRGELFFESDLFDGALRGKMGVRATYWSAYDGYAYMPATRRFYLQNEKRIGDHPFFDVFFHGKVQNILFFAELNHGNASLMGRNYYGAPRYPLRDLMVRVGFKWDIFN